MKRRLQTRALVCLAGLVTSLLLAGIVLAARRQTLLQTSTTCYTPLSGEAEWEGNWEFSELGADPSQAGTERVTIPFTGTDFALRVRRGNYRGYFFVSVDGEPANLLPREKRGAYLVLSSPDYAEQVVTIPVASGLDDGPHVAVIIAERGWDQWPLTGWSISRTPDTTIYRWALMGLGTLGLACLGGTVWWKVRGQERQEDKEPREQGDKETREQGDKGTGRQGDKEPREQGDKETREQGNKGTGRQGDKEPRGQEAKGKRCSVVSILHSLFSILHSLFSILHSLFSILYSPFSILYSPFSTLHSPLSILLAAGVFYFSSWLSSTPVSGLVPGALALVSGLALGAIIILRLDLGLALVAAAAPFYLYPRPLFGKTFSMVEITTLLCLLSWGLRQLATRLNRQASIQYPISSIQHPASSLDHAAILFVAVAIASFFVAEYRHVALRELRLVVLEPAFFYLMLRTSRLDNKALWRIVDFFVLGAVAVALIGLVQYGLGVHIITAEEGFRRLRSVYGSPNSVGLYLGRTLPVLLTVALFGTSRGRRIAYGLAVVPLGLAVLLSFSKGALILGVPLSLLALGALAGGPWLRAALGTVAVAAVAAIPLLRTPRFASLLDTQSGTTFLRLQLWRSSWTMFRDHPWFGVGPDNFLYHYRGRYILPAAWEEPHISQAHNILLDYATRMGLVGLAAGAWLQVSFWRLALPLRRLTDPDRRALALGLMGSMVYFLAHGLVDASYFLIDLAFVFFLTLGLVQHLARSEADELKT
ncbi:MAG: O-antigen ligase family protein [Chloroflexota bacterium]|nr:O-antigen ligase family protein [Chloroflexota bacterium]